MLKQLDATDKVLWGFNALMCVALAVIGVGFLAGCTEDIDKPSIAARYGESAIWLRPPWGYGSDDRMIMW